MMTLYRGGFVPDRQHDTITVSPEDSRSATCCLSTFVCAAVSPLLSFLPDWSITPGPLSGIHRQDAHVADDTLVAEPFCMKCSHQYFSAMAVPESDSGFRALVRVPHGCARCTDPVDLDSLEYCESWVCITPEERDVLTSAQRNKLSNVRMSVDTQITSLFSRSGASRVGLRSIAMKMFLARVLALQNEPVNLSVPFCRRIWLQCFETLFSCCCTMRKASDCIHPVCGTMHASPFRPFGVNVQGVLADVTPPDRSILVPFEAQDARAALDGGIFGRVFLKTSEHTGRNVRRQQDLERIPGLVVCDSEVAFLRRLPCLGRQIGPLLGQAVIWDHQSVINMETALRERTKILTPWSPTKDVKKKHNAYFRAAMANCFTRVRILEKAREMPILALLCKPKLSEEQATLAIQSMIGQGVECPEAILKLETTVKPKKPPRIVVNVGTSVQLLSAMVVKIFEACLEDFDHSCNIKHRGKDEVCEDISLQLSSVHHAAVGVVGPFVCVEIDHTAYEYQQTATRGAGCSSVEDLTGLMRDEVAIFRFIHRTICETRNQVFAHTNMWVEELAGTQVKLSVRLGDKETGPCCWKTVFPYLYRKSGGKETSSANRYNGIKSALIAFTSNPEHFWSGPPGGNAPTDYVDIKGNPLYFRFWGEGDDFLGQVNAITANYEQDIIKNFRCMGLTVKLKFVKGPSAGAYAASPDLMGRAEFVGVHFGIVDGCGSSGVWVPDVVRALVKSGITTSHEPDKWAVGEAVYLSRAIGFAGKIPKVATFFYECALSCATKKEGSMRCDYDLALLAGQSPADLLEVGTLYRMYGEKINLSVPACHPAQLLSMSAETVVSQPDYDAWSPYPRIGAFTPSSEVVWAMPKALRHLLHLTFLYS